MRGPSGIAWRLAISIAVFAAVLWFIDIGQFFRTLAAVDPLWFALALGANVAAMYFSARALAALCGGLVGPAAIFRVNLTSVYFGTFIPGDVAAGLVARIRYLGLSAWQQVLHLTVIERLVGLASFSVIAAAAFAGSRFFAALGPLALLLPLAVLGAAAAGIAVTRRPVETLRRLPALRRLYEKVAPADTTPAPVLAPAAFAWSSATQLGTCLLAFAGLHAIGVEAGFLDAIVVGYILALAQLVPLFFAGAGIRDVSAISLLGAVGIRPEAAVAFSTLVLAIILIIAVCGGVLQVRAERERVANGGA